MVDSVFRPLCGPACVGSAAGPGGGAGNNNYNKNFMFRKEGNRVDMDVEGGGSEAEMSEEAREAARWRI